MNMAAMTLKILHQDAIKATVDNWPRSKQLIAYKYLNALGCKLDGIDYEIDKETKKEFRGGDDRSETLLKQHSVFETAGNVLNEGRHF
jgi:hypothetical protein